MPKKIPSKTRPEAKKVLYQSALKEKMKSWKCFERDPSKRIPCRELLLQLIKIHLIFPLYRKQYPKATLRELEDMWDTPESSPGSRSTSSSSRRGSPDDLVLRCPRCKSDDIVIEGQGTAICRICAHNWQVPGNFASIFVAKSKIQMPTIQAYVDSKGKEIDTDFPKIFHTKTAMETYLQKSIQELLEILRNYSKKWEVQVWSTFVKKTIFMWIKYLESKPPGKGMPKKTKRTALLAVFTYYGSIVSNRELTWEQVAEIFSVLPRDMDKLKNKEIRDFWATPEGAAVSSELFPLLLIRETPRVEEPNVPILLNKIRREEPKATKLGLEAYIAKLEGYEFELPEDVKRTVANKERSIVESWFDDHPSELKKLFSEV